jgi:hypothetical protein
MAVIHRGHFEREICGNKTEIKMATTTMNQAISATYTQNTSSTSFVRKFFAWCKGQDENRFLWLGIVLAGHGCILTPLTVMAVLLAGTNMLLFVLAIVSMGMSLVTNLAAMPTKITIPVFALSVLIDIAIIISCAAMGFDITKTYI